MIFPKMCIIHGLYSMEPGEWSGQKLYCYKSILKVAYIYPLLFAGPAFWWIES